MRINRVDLSFMLLEMYDLRNALPAKVKAMKANDENTDYTIGDLIDSVIEKLENSRGQKSRRNLNEHSK